MLFKSNNKQEQYKSKTYNEKWTLVLSIVTLIVAIATTSKTNNSIKEQQQQQQLVLSDSNIIDPNSIYVPGSGLSGGFYTYGRLDKMNDLSSKQIYCYSSGCIAAAAVLNNTTVAEAMEIAANAREQFMSGKISFHEFNDVIFDGLLFSAHKENDNSTLWGDNFAEIASHLHIITTVRNGWFGFKTVIRTPQTLEELREMLKQSAWVPFMTGNSFMHNGHLDGAFDILGHPKCAMQIGIPVDYRIWLNMFNFNLNTPQAQSLWQIGYDAPAIDNNFA